MNGLGPMKEKRRKIKKTIHTGILLHVFVSRIFDFCFILQFPIWHKCMSKQISVCGHHISLKKIGKGLNPKIASLKTLVFFVTARCFCVILWQFSIDTHCWPYVATSAVWRKHFSLKVASTILLVFIFSSC